MPTTEPEPTEPVPEPSTIPPTTIQPTIVPPPTSTNQYKSYLGLSNIAQYFSFGDFYHDVALAKAEVPPPPEIENVRLKDITDIYLPEKLIADKLFWMMQVTNYHMGIFFFEDYSDVRPMDPTRREYGFLYYHGEAAKNQWDIINRSFELSNFTDDIYFVIQHTNNPQVPPVMYSYYWWQDDVFMWFYCYGEEAHDIVKDDVLSYINSIVKTPIESLLPDIKNTETD